MNERPRTADGSGSNRMRAAGVRAADAYACVTRCARKLSEEMDEITAPHGVPLTDLSDEDSMVIAVATVIESGKRSAKG